MKKVFKIAAASLAFSFLGAFNLSPVNTSFASEAPQRLDLGFPLPNVAFKESIVKLTQTEAQKKEVLNEIKKLRAKAWDEDIYFTFEEEVNSKGEKIRDVAFEAGLRNKEAYVNAIKWNTRLEQYAIQRAYEDFITDFAYNRADGSDPFDSHSKLLAGYSNEFHALSYEGMNPATAVGIWSTEKLDDLGGYSAYDYLLAANGVWANETSDLFNIIDPFVTDFGYAQLSSIEGTPSYGVLIVANQMKTTDTRATGYNGSYKLYVGDPNAKPLSESTKKALRKALSDAQMQSNVAYNLMENYPKTVERVWDKLVEIMDESYYLQQSAYGMLGEFKSIE